MKESFGMIIQLVTSLVLSWPTLDRGDTFQIHRESLSHEKYSNHDLVMVIEGGKYYESYRYGGG